MSDNGPDKGARIAVIGGGAAGFFAAITAAESAPGAAVTLYERGARFLAKVRISGGGRCNVTHACFDPADLATRYPRGARELRAAFHRWQPRDTVAWFEERGVRLKTEPDGRMFPVSDDSQTIVDCLSGAARSAGVRLLKGVGLKGLGLDGDGFVIERTDAQFDRADRVCVAAGSLKGAPLAGALEGLGHTIEPLAPSLFAFNIADPRLDGLAGLSVESATVRPAEGGGPRDGPVLVTHRGLSGPAILKLSAWEARRFAEAGYRFEIVVDWSGGTAEGPVRERFETLRRRSGRTAVRNTPWEGVPRRLWERLTVAAGIGESVTWAQLPGAGATALLRELTAGRYRVDGKTTNKDEFVTCGGVRLKEVDFRTMESRIVPGLHFAGECLDIDGVTGGFNFQAAWTTGHIAGVAMATA